MSYRRGGLGLFGLLAVVALGVMAFVSSAQALTPGFLIAKKAPAAGLKANFNGVQEGIGTLSVPALNTEINCTGFTVQEGVVETESDAKVKLLYEGCTVLVLSTKEEATGCEVVTADTGSTQKHITATGLVLPTELTGGAAAILVEKIEATVLTKPTEGCVLPTTTKIKGEVCLKITSGNDTTEPLVQSNATIQGECVERTALEGMTIGKGFKDKLLFGAQEATITGAAKLFLTGAHEKLTLGVSPVPSGTTLCKAKEGSCEAYALGSKISASLEEEVKFVFPYEGEELEPPCRVSSISGVTTKEGLVLIGEVTALSFKECGGGLCTVAAQHLPYKFEVKATAEGNGTMTWSNAGSGAPAFSIKCLGIAKCIYGATEVALTVSGGAPAKLSSGGLSLKREEGSAEACGVSGAKWEGVAAAEGNLRYKITSPSPLFVRLI